MSDATIRVNDEIELPLAQAITLARLTVEHPRSSWHLNDCGCCVCLHPNHDDNSDGWIISSGGEATYLARHA